MKNYRIAKHPVITSGSKDVINIDVVQSTCARCELPEECFVLNAERGDDNAHICGGCLLEIISVYTGGD